MTTVEATSWKGIGHCGMAEPRLLAFYQQMLRRLSVSMKPTSRSPARAKRVLPARSRPLRMPGRSFGAPGP